MRRFWSRFADRSSNLEKTQMSPEFLDLTKKYDTYKECNDVLVERLEASIQQNQAVIAGGKIIDAPNENPFEKFSNSLFSLYSCIPSNKHSCIQSWISTTQNLAKVQREHQVNHFFFLPQSSFKMSLQIYSATFH
ncbi:unnamed protein product [Onchocerca flexuosa]|uniref:BAR domain-containing protein n=1 Tax=Onchocerca flexuosa TaxID=387005 RepID=A0A183HM67_9BILA|nr:unnamed protein product [Onchocerca flexuosa]